MTQLHVHVVSALHLEPKDLLTQSSDPFVEVSFHGQTKRTSVIRDSLNPCWDEVIRFDLRPHVLTLNDILMKRDSKEESPTISTISSTTAAVASRSSPSSSSRRMNFHFPKFFHSFNTTTTKVGLSSPSASSSNNNNNTTLRSETNASSSPFTASSHRGSPSSHSFTGSSSSKTDASLFSSLGYVHFQVWDYDRYKHNEKLGECYVPLGSIFDGYLMDEQWDGKPWWFQHATPLLIGGKRKSKEMLTAHDSAILMKKNKDNKGGLLMERGHSQQPLTEEDDQLTQSVSIESWATTGEDETNSGTVSVHPQRISLDDFQEDGEAMRTTNYYSPSRLNHLAEEQEHVLYGKYQPVTKESFNYLFDEKVQELLVQEAKQPQYLEMELEKTSKRSFLIVELYLSGIVRSRQY